VLSERVEMGVFNGGFMVSVMLLLVLLAYFLLYELKLSWVERSVADDVS